MNTNMNTNTNINITVNTDSFKLGLEKVSKVIPTKTSVETLNNIKVTLRNGDIILTSTNLISYVTSRLDSFPKNIVQQDITFLLDNVKELLKAFKFFKDANTVLKLEDDKLTLTCGNKTMSRMVTLGDDKFPILPKIEEGDITDILLFADVKDFKKRFDSVKYAVMPKSNWRENLISVHFNEFDMVTTDGYRIAINNGNEHWRINQPFSVPFEELKTAMSIFKNGTFEIISSKNYIEMKDYIGTSVIIRLIDKDFFNYKSALNTSINNCIEINVNEITDALKYLNEIKADPIKWGGSKINAKNKNGIFEVELEKSEELPIEVCLNGRFLEEVMVQFKEAESILLCYNNNKNPLTFKDNNGNIAVLMPVVL